jgi:miniconductance mechanosensitive channel
MLARFRNIALLQDYLDAKLADIQTYNAGQAFEGDSPVNGRQLTNVGTYRAYIIAYLRQHPMINRDMTFLVRQLAPTPHGLPLEVYVFSRDKVWANYEAIQADIFDHLLAVIPEFGLRVYQEPAGSDFRALAEHTAAWPVNH